jgi:hypothetical protein
MAESDADTERVAVRTYVPRYQRDNWDEQADELDMSRSEFVRSMVQAGRRGFFHDEDAEAPTEEEDGATGPASSGSDLEDQVVEALAADEYRSWDELLEAVTNDIEDNLEATLQDLQAAGRVRYSGRNGGYTLDGR